MRFSVPEDRDVADACCFKERVSFLDAFADLFQFMRIGTDCYEFASKTGIQSEEGYIRHRIVVSARQRTDIQFQRDPFRDQRLEKIRDL